MTVEEVKNIESIPKSEDNISSDLITKATEAAERLENANKELSKLIAIQQQLQVQTILSGKTEAGKQGQSEDEKEILAAKKMLEGTGMEDYAFPGVK